MSEIAERLGPVCSGWEAKRFEALVRRIAELEMRWLDREGRAMDGRHPIIDSWQRAASPVDGNGREHNGNGREHDGNGREHDGRQPEGRSPDGRRRDGGGRR